MRLVEGDSLAAVLARNGPISHLRTALIVEQVASALDAAHADGLVHRDVKPSNVLLTRIPTTGGHDFVYLVDFGISRALKRPLGASLTATGAMIGTPEYMAPERFVDGSIDQQADVYALACLVYECLTGRVPFPVKDLPALIYAHVNTPPTRPSTLRPGIPESVDAIIAVGMAKDPLSGIPALASLRLRFEPRSCQVLTWISRQQRPRPTSLPAPWRLPRRLRQQAHHQR
jgi:serine/threonine protein kinase